MSGGPMRGLRFGANRAQSGGALVTLVGPDGVGKTSVARALCESVESAAYFHFRPPVLKALLDSPPLVSVPPPTKGSPNGSRTLGWVRLARNFLWFWLAYLVRVRPALRKGHLVVGDRWAYGYLTQPFALKYYGPRWLASAVIRALPQPDLIANLTASPGLIFDRKKELTREQIESELRGWADLSSDRMQTFDATSSPGKVAEGILMALRERRGYPQHKDFPPGWHHLSIPTSTRNAALAGIAMYTASRTRGVLAQQLAWYGVLALGPGVLPGRRRRWNPPFDRDDWATLLEMWTAGLGTFDTFAVYRPRQLPRKGLALLLLHDANPVAFVKVRQDSTLLINEQSALEAVAKHEPITFKSPAVLGHGSTPSLHYLALSPLPPRIHRAPRHPDLESITGELAVALETLPRPRGTPDHWQPIHGDFTPWNLRRNQADLYLLDWEDAGWGPPGADAVFYCAAGRALGQRQIRLEANPEAASFWIDRLGRQSTSDRFRERIIRVLSEMVRDK